MALFVQGKGGVSLASRKVLLGEHTLRVLGLRREALRRLGKGRRIMRNAVAVKYNRFTTIRALTGVYGACGRGCPLIRVMLRATATSTICRVVGGKLMSVTLFVRPISARKLSCVQVASYSR